MEHRESSFSLEELEPSPVEETPADFKGDGYFPAKDEERKGNSASQLGLSNHSTLWYLNQVQKYSTYLFSAFAGAHIANTSIIPLVTQSVPASESFLLLTRRTSRPTPTVTLGTYHTDAPTSSAYYQGIPFEPLLIIAPAYAHVLSGLAIRLYRRNLHAKRYGDAHETKGVSGWLNTRFWPAVSGTSKLGFQLIPLLAGHVFINRAIPQNFPGGSSNINLGYVSHAFATHPVVSFAGFGLLLTVGCWHITWGWAKWLGYTPNQVTSADGGDRALARKRRWYVINGVAAAVTGGWMAGAFGVVGRGGQAAGWLARQYDEMYRSIPIVGRWM